MSGVGSIGHTVVIVGGGFSGTMTALNLLRGTSQVPLHVVLIERSGNFGMGLAYDTVSERLRLNVKTCEMGAWPDDHEHFLRWLHGQGRVVEPQSFVPRAWYGEYLGHLIEDARASSAPHTLELVHDDVADIEFKESSNIFSVTGSGGRSWNAAAVVLALGNLKRESCDGILVRGVFDEPYTESTYREIAGDTKVLVVGCGLTAVDFAVEAEGRGYRGQYVFLSRHGLFPTPHGPEIPMPEAAEKIIASRSVRFWLKTVREASPTDVEAQSNIKALRPAVCNLWRELPEQEKSRFLRHVRPYYEIYRHRIPVEHADLLRGLREAGRLTVRSGRLVSASKAANGAVDVAWRPRGERATHKDNFSRAVLCVGGESSLGRMRAPLAQNLLRRGYLKDGRLGLGASVDVTAAPATVTKRLLMVGPLQREALWEITSVRELRTEAASTAAHIIKDLSPVA